MDISDYRNEIDRLDQELVAALDRRMRLAEKIAEYKKANGLKVVDPVRERALLDQITDASAPDMAYYNRMLFSAIMETSRDHQRNILGVEAPVMTEIRSAIENGPRLFPDRALVACQGVQGAYSQEACDRCFKMPKIMYVKNFRGVFKAIESGLCEYGILPIENSTAGSVNQVYDLMSEYNFHIVKSVRLKVRHSLLVPPGTKKEDIREIFSHEQAIAQCDEYLKQFPDAKITVMPNTALAAKLVADSGRTDCAALASRANGENYGLVCLEDNIQDVDNNYTRFICITRDLRIYPGAERTSIMMVLDHRPGALYQVLARFNAMGINLLKLESRPLPEREFEFMFYFDIEEPVYSEEFIRMMGQLQQMSIEYKYLGSYLEV